MLSSTRELIDLFPYSMRERARGYIDYISDVLYEVTIDLDLENRRADFQYEVETVFIFKFLYSFLVTGYDNYEGTLRYLESKGATGFEIGSTQYRSPQYSRQNTLTANWLNLRANLLQLVNVDDGVSVSENRLLRYVQSNASVRSIIEDIVRSAS